MYSPVVEVGEADAVVAFELLEAARWIGYLKPGGKLIANTQRINPMPVVTGAAAYPDNLVEKMMAAGVAVDAFDALALAVQAGSARAVNVVLLGRLSRMLPYAEAEWLTGVRDGVPAAYVDLNTRAFLLGRGAGA